MSVEKIAVPKDFETNLRWRRQAILDGGSVPGAAERFVEQCRNDVLFWINTFCFTYDPRLDETVIPFVTYDFQDKAILRIIDDIHAGRDVAIKKSRDMGASWINIIAILWMWQFLPMKNFLMVSRNESYVDGNQKSLFWKIDFLLQHQPSWLRPKLDDTERKLMHIYNPITGSVIDGESTTGEVARGDRRTAILMDEFAAFDTKNGYNAYAATQSATDCRIFNSTPKGVGNAFYDVCHKSSADIISMHWSEHPEKSKGLYTAKRDNTSSKLKLRLLDDFHGMVEVRSKGSSEAKFVLFPDDYPFQLDGKKRSPWYDLQCARAITSVEIAQELDIDFQGSDYNFFDPVAIERYRDNYCREPSAIGDIDLNQSALSVLGFTPNQHGKLSLFEMPGKSGRWDIERSFVVGADISAGTGASNSTLAIYDKVSKEKVAEYVNPKILPDDFARLTIGICKWFNNALLVPDRTGPTGEVFMSRMITDGQGIPIFRCRDNKRIDRPLSNRQGVFLSSEMRTTILQQYRDAISRVSVINRSHVAMAETLRFICTPNGFIEHSSASSSKDPSGARTNHGDLVIADALATYALDEESVVEQPKNVEPTSGMLAWRMEMARREENMKQSDTLGEEWTV